MRLEERGDWILACFYRINRIIRMRSSLKYVHQPFKLKTVFNNPFVDCRLFHTASDYGKNLIVINAHESKQKTLVRYLVCVCLRHLVNFLSGTLSHSSCCLPYVSPAGLSPFHSHKYTLTYWSDTNTCYCSLKCTLLKRWYDKNKFQTEKGSCILYWMFTEWSTSRLWVCCSLSEPEYAAKDLRSHL